MSVWLFCSIRLASVIKTFFIILLKHLTRRGENLLIKENNDYDCKFIKYGYFYRQTMTMFQIIACLLFLVLRVQTAII